MQDIERSPRPFGRSTSGDSSSGPGTTTSTPKCSVQAGSRSSVHYFTTNSHPSQMYKPKKHRKAIRVLTVVSYMIAVSLVALVLSLYYFFLWDPYMPLSNETFGSWKVSRGSTPVSNNIKHWEIVARKINTLSKQTATASMVHVDRNRDGSQSNPLSLIESTSFPSTPNETGVSVNEVGNLIRTKKVLESKPGEEKQ